MRGAFHQISRGIKAHPRFLDHQVESERVLPVQIAVDEETGAAALDQQFPGVPRGALSQAREHMQLQFERRHEDRK